MMMLNLNLSKGRQWLAAGVALACWAGVLPAIAGMSITPVSVELSGMKRVGRVTITNTGTTPVIIQSGSALWSQVNNVDRYDETDALLVVPAIVEIPAKTSQLFRVTLRGAFPKAGEQAFRLYLEDVTEFTEGKGVNLRIRHDLPVMVAGAAAGKALPRLGACADPAPAGCVRLSNDGSRRLKTQRIFVEGAGWHKDLKTPTMVLAGAWKEWTFDLPRQGSGSMKVTAETSGGPVSAELSLPPR